LQQKWPEPAWIAELQESHRPTAKLRFFLNLAAAYHSESGALTELSESCGLNRAHLNVCRQRGRVSPEIAVRLEEALGRDTFPRELFNDIFAVAER
jgi:hypothetical protein